MMIRNLHVDQEKLKNAPLINMDSERLFAL